MKTRYAISILAVAGFVVGVLWSQFALQTAPPMHIPAPATKAPPAPDGFGFVARTQRAPLPTLKFIDGDKKPLSLDDFRGKLVLLNLWATWCGPCREEMPTLNHLQETLGGKDFEVLTLSLDQQIEEVQDFFRELNLKALNPYLDVSFRAPQDLKVLGVPATLLIDREGREIGRLLGPAEWDSPAALKLIRSHLDG